MKSTLKYSVFSVLFLASLSTHAQFLKNLGKKVSEAAEKSLTKKSEEKTSKAVEKSFDGIFSVSPSSKPKSPSTKKPDATYKFSYHYKMQVEAQGQSLLMDFFFKPNENHLGIAMNQQGVEAFSIMDYDKNSVFNFMDYQNKKILTSMRLENDSYSDTPQVGFENSDFTVKGLPEKVILGFTCQGKQLENDDWQYTFYYTDEIKVNFQDILKASKQQDASSKVISRYLPNANEVMLMYMKSIDKRKRKPQTATMQCVEFNTTNKTFATESYEAIGF